MNRRFEFRPIASRRLRAALLLVYALGLLALWQTRFTGVELAVAVASLSVIMADAWRRTRVPELTLVFFYQPLSCTAITPAGESIALSGTRASVYPWLIVLQFESSDGALPRGLRKFVVLLPDSLDGVSTDTWRRLLVWSQLLRRRLANR
jgi:hypothetical protein